MHRYSLARWLLVGLAAMVTGCAVPTPRDNATAAAELVTARVGAKPQWRRDAAEDEAARQRVAELLDDGDGASLDDAVAVSFLANPTLQVAFEQLAISRTGLVAAVTPKNPVGVAGARKAGGDLAAFYPDRAVSIGVLQDVFALLTMPDRIAIARLDLQRARYATAQQAVEHSVQVVQEWLEYSAALQILELRGGAEAVGAEMIRAELDAVTARVRLAELMGVTGWHDDWKLTTRLPSPPVSDPDAAALESAAMKQRLDLLAAFQAVEVRLRTLAMNRRFRWLNQLDVGLFRDKVLGGTPFTGPNAVFEIPLFDQRQALLLQSDAELRTALREVEALQMKARTEIRVQSAELRAMRRQLQLWGSVEGREADPDYVAALREYWRTRSALAFASGDWAAISGL
jgi:outer membrane protein, heavy metal efflux system